MTKNTDNLLARYFGGNILDNDMAELEEWISASTENQTYFDQMTNLYEKSGRSDRAMPEPDIALAKEKFIHYITSQQETESTPVYAIRRIPFYKNRMFQAASIALLMMLSIATWKVFLSGHETTIAYQMASKDEMLPDQTQVILSKNSKITYGSDYSKNDKTIRLEGEANFRVGHAGKGRLQVIANETFIEDIGTVFAVTAYPDSNYVSVRVREGQVHFYTRNNNGLKIGVGETGIYNKQSKAFKILAQRIDSLQAGSMHVDFQAMGLKDAIDIISNAYKVKINLADKSIGNRKITVNFDGEDVNIVLQIIAQTLDLQLVKGDNGYQLSNKKIRL